MPSLLRWLYRSETYSQADLVRARDEELGMDTEAKKTYRASYLPAYETVDGPDKSGKGLRLAFVDEADVQ